MLVYYQVLCEFLCQLYTKASISEDDAEVAVLSASFIDFGPNKGTAVY